MTSEMLSKSKILSLRDQFLAQNFDAFLAVIVKLAGDPVFAKFCHNALQLFLRHPQIHILQFCSGGFGNYVEQRMLIYVSLR